MKAVAYARVSTKEQEETGYSLPSQVKLLTDYCDQKGFGLTRKPFAVSESASGKMQRKTFNEMLVYANEHKIKIIVCEKTDRLTRNMKDSVMVNEWMNKDPEREVHFVKEGTVFNKDSKSHEKFVWNMKASVAQLYTDNLSEEVRKGQREKISQGGYPSWAPVGYRSMGEKGHKSHAIDENMGPLIKRAFELYGTGLYSVQSLLDVLDKDGLRSRNGRHLTKSRVYYLLRNPFYYGEFLWNGILHKGIHEPLITKEEYEIVQSVLSGKSQPRKRIHSHLFRGLLRCDECGGMITWQTHKGHHYGCCHRFKPCNQHKYTREEKIETGLMEYLDQLVIDNQELAEWVREGLKMGHQDENEFHQKTNNNLQEQYERYRRRLEMLYEDRLDGVISKEVYEQKQAEYKEEIEKITDSIETHKKSNLNYHERSIKVFELSQDAKNLYNESTNEERRVIISEVFQNLRLKNSIFTAEFSEPYKILYAAVQVTNGSEVAKSGKIQFSTSEPVGFGSTNEKTDDFSPVRSIWRSGRDLNPRPPP